jgi:hypothetical protein
MFGRFHALKASSVLIDEATRAIRGRRRAGIDDDVVVALQVHEEYAVPIVTLTDRCLDAPKFAICIFDTAGSHGDLFPFAVDVVSCVVAVQL